MWRRQVFCVLSHLQKPVISKISVIKPNYQALFFKRCFHKSQILESSSPALDLSNIALKNYVQSLLESNEKSSLRADDRITLEHLWKNRHNMQEDLHQLKQEISKDPDEELKKMAAEETKDINQKIAEIDAQILDLVLPTSTGVASDVHSLYLEVTAGVGGQEAMLFAADIIAMYEGFIAYNGWDRDVTEIDKSDIGGLRHGSISISGQGAFEAFSMEAGVHRVQRVPKTEKSGRIHTSTVTVAVLPQPTEVQINISPKDLKIETKRSSGAGGQHVNTTDSCVRIVHLPTGLFVESQSERSQIQNRTVAMNRLRAKLFQKELEKQEADTRSTRKQQVGSSFRSEKIRTYNFPQDRVTDHRISKNYHNIHNFLLGGESLAELNQELLEKKREETLQIFLASLN